MKKKRIAFTGIGILVVFGVIYLVFNRDDERYIYTTEFVEQGDVIQTVSETGEVKSASQIELNFLNPGKIDDIYYKVGDEVEEGDVLAELDNESLFIKLQEAKAGRDVAVQNLNKLLAGATKEEVRVSEASVKQAESSWEAAKSDLENVRKTSLENLEQAKKTLADLESEESEDVTIEEQAVKTAIVNIRNTEKVINNSINNFREMSLVVIREKVSIAESALDAVDLILNDADIEMSLSVKNKEYLNYTEAQYDVTMNNLEKFRSGLVIVDVDSNEEVQELLVGAIDLLTNTFDVVQNCYSALISSVTSADLSKISLDAYKTSISGHKTLVNAGITELRASKQSLDDSILKYETDLATAESALASSKAALNKALINAKNAVSDMTLTATQQITSAESRVDNTWEAYEFAKAQLNKLLASANKHDILLARAQVRQAEASLKSIEKQIETSTIIAPISGIITKVNYEVGEQVGGGKSVISMLEENNYEIEVLISESDISKIDLKDEVEVTLDAFGDDVVFKGRVIFIEPAETEIQDVVYYQVDVSFDPGDEEVKSGMTADVLIKTDRRDNVLMIPNRSVISKVGMDKIVRILKDGNEVEERVVKTGLRGDDGVVEVLSGVKMGEKVITYIEEK